MNVLTYVVDLLQTGLGALAAYLAAHVLLCLLPAFFIAGALSALIPKEAITKYLGRDAPKWISYPASAVGGFVLAVCSCTIMPLFASIYKKGAGLGPAITFLFVGPAINILAISFTGVQIGMDIALARIILSIVFGVGIGLLMAFFFHKDDAARISLLPERADAYLAQKKYREALFDYLKVAFLNDGPGELIARCHLGAARCFIGLEGKQPEALERAADHLRLARSRSLAPGSKWAAQATKEYAELKKRMEG